MTIDTQIAELEAALEAAKLPLEGFEDMAKSWKVEDGEAARNFVTDCVNAYRRRVGLIQGALEGLIRLSSHGYPADLIFETNPAVAKVVEEQKLSTAAAFSKIRTAEEAVTAAVDIGNPVPR